MKKKSIKYIKSLIKDNIKSLDRAIACCQKEKILSHKDYFDKLIAKHQDNIVLSHEILDELDNLIDHK